MKPRDYQDYGVQSVFDYFSKGNTGNPLVVMPTGTGKSLVIAEFIRRALCQYPGTRIMKLTHVKELIEQNLDKLLKVWPTAPAGVYSNGLKKKDSGFPITFGGVGTVAKVKDMKEVFGRIDLLIIDEAHLISPKANTMYQKVITKLREINPLLKVIGLTATPFRLGQGMLTEGDSIFTDICVDMSKMEIFNWFIDQGYLCPLIPKRPEMELDLSGVRIQGSEFKQNDLQQAVDKEEITFAAVQEMIRYGQDRKRWLIFASGIEHAINVRDMLISMGITATCVHSKMPDAERDQNLADFKSGKYRAMVNNGVLTTGFDDPYIDLIGMLRATMSPSLWVQMLGRGTRPVYCIGFDLGTKEGRLAAIANSQKHNCLVLDFAGNARRLGPINDPVIPKRKGSKGGGTAPVRLCEACQTYNHASARFCIHCGAEFPRDLHIQEYASSDKLIADGKDDTELNVQVFKVDKTVYTLHDKDGGVASIKASYYCGLRIFNNYICLDHEGYARKRARDYWRAAALEEPPESIQVAMTKLDTLRSPTHVRVWLNKKSKYDQVLDYDYTNTAFGSNLPAR